MGNKNSVSIETEVDSEASEPFQCENLELFNTLQSLPDGINNLKSVKSLSKEILRERREIIKKLRNMAHRLSKTHSDVLIADRVGTGVGIGSGLLFIGGLVAAPFTAGLSLALTVTATTTGVMGAITSAGANITGFVMTKNSLDPLQKELDEHLKHIADFSKIDTQYLNRAARFRPTLEVLAKLSELEWCKLFKTIQNIIPCAFNGDNTGFRKAVIYEVSPEITSLLEQLSLPLDRKSLLDLSAICTYILDHVKSIKQAVVAFLNFLNKPELVGLAMVYTNSTVKSITATTQEVAQIKSAFKGTPMAMTKTVRVVAGVATTAFIILDVIHMVRICKETGETPTVQNLLKMADDLEKEFQLINEIESDERTNSITDNEKDMEVTPQLILKEELEEGSKPFLS